MKIIIGISLILSASLYAIVPNHAKKVSGNLSEIYVQIDSANSSEIIFSEGL
jgi:hypothetical protein